MTDPPTPGRGPAAGHPPPGSAAPRRWRDLAIMLPVFGLMLFMPPLIGLAVGPGTIAGVPTILVYVFGVWAALIAVAAALCRVLVTDAAGRRQVTDAAVRRQVTDAAVRRQGPPA